MNYSQEYKEKIRKRLCYFPKDISNIILDYISPEKEFIKISCLADIWELGEDLDNCDIYIVILNEDDDLKIPCLVLQEGNFSTVSDILVKAKNIGYTDCNSLCLKDININLPYFASRYIGSLIDMECFLNIIQSRHPDTYAVEKCTIEDINYLLMSINKWTK